MYARPSVNIENHPTHVVVRLTGEFDLDVADNLRDALGVAVRTKPQVVVDLTGTEFMDSVALGCLVMAAKLARSQSGWFRLAGPQRSLHRTLRITGLDAVLSIHRTVEDAVASLPSTDDTDLVGSAG